MLPDHVKNVDVEMSKPCKQTLSYLETKELAKVPVGLGMCPPRGSQASPWRGTLLSRNSIRTESSLKRGKGDLCYISCTVICPAIGLKYLEDASGSC
jgi:hypothetical protein